MAAVCRSCEAPIVWAKTEAKAATDTKGPKPSRAMPLDADPDTGQAAVPGNGNLVVIGYDGPTPIVRYIPAGKGMHVSHFATCPNRDEHRRSR